jgi:hypothetical protein
MASLEIPICSTSTRWPRCSPDISGEKNPTALLSLRASAHSAARHCHQYCQQRGPCPCPARIMRTEGCRPPSRRSRLLSPVVTPVTPPSWLNASWALSATLRSTSYNVCTHLPCFPPRRAGTDGLGSARRSPCRRAPASAGADTHHVRDPDRAQSARGAYTSHRSCIRHPRH